jgi:3(or 17)beta-hydroxysteroid dehydrogenase
MDRVEGKVCLVTGGGSGLGRADAVRLAQEGASVVVTDVDVAGGEETVALAGANTVFMQHDVAEEGQWQTVIADCLSHFGKLNVVVNNAGIVIPGDVESVTTEDWRLQQRIHMDGAFFGMKYGIGAIKQNDELGSIINMSSTTALQGYSMVFAYGAAKGAIRTMTKHAAVHCLNMGYRIRVNSLHPGVINTPMVQRFTAATANAASEEPAPSPVGLGDPVDVANAVLFLASDESRFINGVELPIDNTATIQP